MLKRLVRNALQRLDMDIVRLNPEELLLREQFPGLDYKELQIIKTLLAPSQVSLEEARFLGALTAGADKTRPILEIGTLFGYSTRIIALSKDPAQPLITVDNYSWNPLGISPEIHFKATRGALAEAIEHFSVTQLKLSKDTFYAEYDQPPPALFFCDADHSYEATKADLAWAKRVGADIICGHDYDPVRHKGVTRAVDEFGGPKRLVGTLFVI